MTECTWRHLSPVGAGRGGECSGRRLQRLLWRCERRVVPPPCLDQLLHAASIKSIRKAGLREGLEADRRKVVTNLLDTPGPAGDR